MKPIGKNIVIKTIDEEVKTSSGLLLSAEDASGFRYKKGQVVKPGNEVEVIGEGDMIYYDKRSGYTMIINDEPYTIISERDVVVVL
tara:strand:+ start:2796 stop:3053 length:258 start_codon:yes stop_codon:yes gene_type:complete